MEEKDRKPRISNSIVPVQVYVMFAIRKMESLTVTQAMDILLEDYSLELDFKRVNQILNELVDAGILEKEIKPAGRRNKLIAHYNYINESARTQPPGRAANGY